MLHHLSVKFGRLSCSCARDLVIPEQLEPVVFTATVTLSARLRFSYHNDLAD
jgi:hypothetical protein